MNKNSHLRRQLPGIVPAVLACLVFSALPAFAAAPVAFGNGDSTLLSEIAAQGGIDPKRLEGQTVSLDDGNAVYRFADDRECAGIAEISFVDGAGNAVEVAGLSAVSYLADGSAQSARVEPSVTDGTSLLVRAGTDQRIRVTFTLGVDLAGRSVTFTRILDGNFSCDGVVSMPIEIKAAPGIRGVLDLDDPAITPADSAFVVATLLDTSLEPVVRDVRSYAKSGFAGDVSSLVKSENSLTCAVDGFDTDTGAWTLANVGDADQGAASLTGGRLELTTDGTSLYHGTDNGAFYYQERSGGFRMEMTLSEIPVNAGGTFKKAGIMVRASNDPSAPRVFIQFVPNNPFTGTTSLQFDYRGNDGVARELGSTPMGLSLPLRLAIDRRGDVFTAYYSTDNGNSWIRPAGAAGGSATIVMPETVFVGAMAASYNATTTLTAAYDDFRLCEPNKIPLPQPPPAVVCEPGRPIDLIHVIDASGSMTNPFGPGQTKLDAVRDAMEAMHDLLAQDLPGSRAALVAYSGRFNDRNYNLNNSVHLLSTLTADLDSVDAAAASIDQGLIHPDSTTPLPFALQDTTQLLLDLGNLNSLPVVVLWTDGFPNVDLQGYDALYYTNDELRNLSLFDGSGNFVPWGQVAWMGRYNPAINTYDGEVFANTMVEIENLKNNVADALIYGVAIQSDSIFKEDLLDYAAWYTSAEVLSVQNSITLVEGLARIVDGLDCGADIGDTVWTDLDADGVQDAGEPGIAGVTVNLIDTAGNVVATTTTDAAGYYFFPDVEAGTYTVALDPATLPALSEQTYDLDGLATPDAATVTVVDDQVLDTVDFGYREIAPATIGDRVWNDANGDGVQDAGEVGIEGLSVTLLDGDGNVVATTTTGADGAYFFGDLLAGTYTVQVETPVFAGTDAEATYDLDGTATAGSATLTVAEGETNNNVDFGYRAVDTGPPWCPRTPGYWKNHLEVWPVDSLTLGGVTYGVDDLLGFLSYGGPDASSRLARHLTATLLNLAMGSDPVIQSSVDAANAFLADNPPGSNPRGRDRGTANGIKDELDAYNNIPCAGD